MEHIRKQIEELVKRYYQGRIRRTLSMIMACVVVFTTVYWGILPAITVNVDTAADMPGMNLILDEAELEAQRTETLQNSASQPEDLDKFASDGLMILEVEEAEDYNAEAYLGQEDNWEYKENGSVIPEDKMSAVDSHNLDSDTSVTELQNPESDPDDERFVIREADTETEKLTETAAEPFISAETEIAAELSGDTEVGNLSEPVAELNTESFSEQMEEAESAPEAQPAVETEPETEPETEAQPTVETEPETESETETQPAVETEPETKIQPVVETEPETEAQPVVETEPESEAQPVVQTEPETEPETEAQPVVETEPETEAQPVVQTEPETEPETEKQPAVETELETEPETKAQPVVETEPETEPETETQQESVKESETEAQPVTETEPESETQPVINEEPGAETQLITEEELETEIRLATEAETCTQPVTEEEPVSETQLVPETEPAIETEPMIETESTTETESVTEAESAVKTEPVMEGESETEQKTLGELYGENDSRPVILTPQGKRAEKGQNPEYEREFEAECESETIQESEKESEIFSWEEFFQSQDPESETEAEPEQRKWTEKDLIPHTEANFELQTEYETEAGTGYEYGSIPEFPCESESEIEPEMESDTEMESETETESDSEMEGESETEAESEILRPYPAQRFDAATKTVRVRVAAEEGAFPAGTDMSVEDVEDDNTMLAITDAVENRVSKVHAVNITFYNAEGEEIEPLIPIRVVMTAEESAATEAVQVVHVDDNGNAEMVTDAHVTERNGDVHAQVMENAQVTGNAQVMENAQVTGNAQVMENAQVTEAAQQKSGDHAERRNKAGQETGITSEADQDTEITFETDQFSIYALVYTVDFHWEANGKIYDYSIPGGGFISFYNLVEVLGIEEDDTDTEKDEIQELLDGVERIAFSSPELVNVSKIEEDTTVEAIKERLGLECEYSAELTEEQIAEINTQTVNAGDWALISLKAFDTEERLTVTMKNGDVWTVNVTDAQVTSLSGIDGEKEYILYTKAGNQYYVLKADGSTEVKSQNELDHLDIQYKWKVSYIYTDQYGNSYYHVIPASDSHKTLALNWFEQPLVGDKNDNQIVIAPYGNAFAFYGYNHVTLTMQNNTFTGLHQKGLCFNLLAHAPYNTDQHDPSPITIYEPAELNQYAFNVNSDDYAMGKVCGMNNSGQYKEDAEYDALTDYNKFNQYEIKAQPQTARYMFDYWDLNGERIENGATIPAGTLSIPYQGSKLTAHFKKDPNWEASDEEKEGRVIDKESFQRWLNELRNRNVPLDQEKCTKTAELYDYENRIYRVDLTAHSNLSMFDGDIDLGFIIDVSGSMQFPSKLVPVSGKESVDVGNINTNYYTQHQLDTNKVYYIIVDRTNTANVLRLKWCGGSNPAYPNHNGWPTGNPNSSSTSWHTGWGISGLGYEEEALDSATRYFTDTSGALFSGDNGPFQIYEAGDNGKRRKEYLESSIAGTISEMKNILGDLAYAQNAEEAADVKVAYNTFANDVDYNHTNHNFVSITDDGLSIGYDYKGGTDTEEALIDAQSFAWSDSATKVAVLITDGAPQQSGLDGPTLDQKVKTAANTLKGGGIKLVTVGLSMGDVKRGSRLLYDIATKDSDGDPYFYKADTGDELQYVLYEVIQQVMAEAIVVGNVTDTVNEAFYPVDKENGAPLEAGNVVDLEGNKIADSEDALTDEQKAKGYGVVGTDAGGNYTVTWTGQNFTWDGWHGTIYEKAKEDFLGGNAVRTNDPEKPARIESEGYKIRPEDPTITFKPEIQAQGSKTLETPRVNVNELDLTDSNTEWTVYLGTEVDPKSQLEAIYDNILVKEVVTAAEDVNGDGFPDRMTGTSLYYPLLESNSDRRESSASGEQVTFKMKDLLKSLNHDNEITIDDLIEAGEDGITLPYDVYGQDCPGMINIKLTKTGETADYNEHVTTVTGDAVETYQLQVDYKPDYEHVPTGQGGDGSKPYHTGNYGLAYQGNAAGEDYSDNTHIINVYAVPLDVYKTDENDEPLAGATFRLYKRDDESGLTVAGIKAEHKFVEVASGTSGADGIAQLKSGGEPFVLKQGETYYLIESSAPEKYVKDDTVWTVEVQTQIGRFTKTDGEDIYSNTFPVVDRKGGVTDDMFPFNWDQGARIMLDGSRPVTVIARGDTEGTEQTFTDGSYVSHKKAISFRHTVKNIGGEIDIHVHKTWNTQEQTPNSVTVKLYRVSEKDHKWGNGRIVPCSCTENGVEEYTCTVCGKKDTHVITAAGHTPGSAHIENEAASTCTAVGGYDTVVRCTVCNAVISSEHTQTPAGHTWGESREESANAAGYCYDTVVRCLICGEEKENTREHHDHVWGEWVETTPAQINVPGEETCYCEHNAQHTMTRSTDPLPATVTVYIRCTGNGGGNRDFPGQITTLATRSGTGYGDMTIQWDWNQWTAVQPFDVDGLVGGSSYTTYSTADGVQHNINNGVERGKRQTLVISNITQNLSVYVTIRNGYYSGTDDSLVYRPTFAGIPAASATTSAKALRRSAAMMRQTVSRSTAGAVNDSGVNDSPGTRNTTLLSGSSKASSDDTEALQSYLDGLKNKEEVTCAGEEGTVHTYKEAVGTYTINADDGWNLDISGQPRYNEYGKEYKYYLVETPVTGYDTTYTGQESGLKEGSTNLEIINTPKTTELTVTKEWAFADPSSVVKVEGKEWPQGATVHAVVYSRTGENDFAPTAYTVDLTADQPGYTFAGLPAYSGNDIVEYSVIETGVTGLDGEHFNTVIEGSAESGFIIRNAEKEAGLTIIKAFEGSELTDAQKNTITFTVTGDGLKDRTTGNSVESLTKTYAEFVEGQWVLNRSDGIVNGRTYTVAESNADIGHYTRVTTVKANDGGATSFVQSSEEANPSGSITISDYQGTVTVTNTYTRLMDLKIIKVDANGMTTPLAGARFELRKVDPENTTLHYLDDVATLPATTGEDHKTGSNGEAVFADLAQGYYEVKETEMPAGYVRTGDGVFYIKVEDSTVSHVERTITVDDKGDTHVTWTPGTDNAKFVFTASNGETPAIAKVGNEPGAALPNTGGSGTNQICLLGLMLTALAAVGLVLKRRRRNIA